MWPQGEHTALTQEGVCLVCACIRMCAEGALEAPAGQHPASVTLAVIHGQVQAFGPLSGLQTGEGGRLEECRQKRNVKDPEKASRKGSKQRCVRGRGRREDTVGALQ